MPFSGVVPTSGVQLQGTTVAFGDYPVARPRRTRTTMTPPDHETEPYDPDYYDRPQEPRGVGSAGISRQEIERPAPWKAGGGPLVVPGLAAADESEPPWSAGRAGG